MPQDTEPPTQWDITPSETEPSGFAPAHRQATLAQDGGVEAPAKRPARSVPPVAYFVAAGVIAVLAALAAATVLVVGHEEHTKAAQAPSVPDAGPAATTYSSAPSTSAFGPIDARSADPKPFTADEVFDPKTIKDDDAKATLKLSASKIDARCANAVWGRRFAEELQRGACTQTTRGVYGDAHFTVMVTIFNLGDAKAADRVVSTAAPQSGNGFPMPLDPRAFGRSFSTARGVAMGHYAVITWAQRNDGTGNEQDRALLSLLVTTGRPEAVLNRAIK